LRGYSMTYLNKIINTIPSLYTPWRENDSV
jgi:hypothetical protein